MRWTAALVLVVLVIAQPADAGAWTLNRGQLAAFVGTTASSASRRYDGYGSPSKNTEFEKFFFQSWMEYGLTDAVTLFAAPEYVIAQTEGGGAGVINVHSASVEAGVRILLLSRIGMLSVQASAKTAGAFDMSVSSKGEAGRQFETRLLYGRDFKLLRRDAFFDIEVAKRWIARPRPDEFAFEGTAGCWVTRNNLVLIQSFSFMTTGGVRSPYEAYELSKLQVSLVRRLTPHWFVQSGYFFSYSGRNMVRETGMIGTIWFRT